MRMRRPCLRSVSRRILRILIECHGGFLYPPCRNSLGSSITDAGLDLSEDDNPSTTTGVSPRFMRSYPHAMGYIPTSNPTDGYLLKLITRTGEECAPGMTDMMPCGVRH